MARAARLRYLLPLLVASAPAGAVTLDEVFVNFQKCEFTDFFFAPWDTTKPVHAYFAERNLSPYKIANGVYYFKVKDTLFGLPVSEVVVPGTQDVHGVVLDVPLAKARAVLQQKFGSTFAPSEASSRGDAPVLMDYKDERGKTVLYCRDRLR